jgi:hypothetical protein
MSNLPILAVVRDLFPFCDQVIPVVGDPMVKDKTIIDDICAYKTANKNTP